MSEELTMGDRTQSTPFHSSLKQGMGFVLGFQPRKFVATLGVLWFQSPKMACNAFTAAEYTVQHYSHVCGILQHLEKKLPSLQILGLESPSHSYN